MIQCLENHCNTRKSLKIKNSKMQKFKNSKIHKFKNSKNLKIQKFWIFEFLNFWIFVFLNFWIFEFLNFWIFEFLNFLNFEFWNFCIFESSIRALLFWIPAFDYLSWVFMQDGGIFFPSRPSTTIHTYLFSITYQSLYLLGNYLLGKPLSTRPRHRWNRPPRENTQFF